MRIFSALALLLLAFALTGAPFGMGRMMDGAHSQSQHAAMAGMDHGGKIGGEAGDHKSNTPHFMMSAACFAAPVSAAQPLERIAFTETLHPLPTVILHGKALLPDLPPPRT